MISWGEGALARVGWAWWTMLTHQRESQPHAHVAALLRTLCPHSVRTLSALFFCYPNVCRYSFDIFRKYRVGPDAQILEADDRFLFEDNIHQRYIYLSYAAIAVIALGVPLSILALLFGINLTTRSSGKPYTF